MPIVTQVEIKYCEDCRWCRRSRASSIEFAKCGHPMCDMDGANYVTRKGEGQYCSLARNGVHAACGKEAKYFEAREVIRVPLGPPWWRRLIGAT